MRCAPSCGGTWLRSTEDRTECLTTQGRDGRRPCFCLIRRSLWTKYSLHGDSRSTAPVNEASRRFQSRQRQRRPDPQGPGRCFLKTCLGLGAELRTASGCAHHSLQPLVISVPPATVPLSGAQRQAPCQPASTGEDEPHRPRQRLCSRAGVMMMGMPVLITLEIRKTRTGWSVRVRVQFLS